jgi:hypothetical protein
MLITMSDSHLLSFFAEFFTVPLCCLNHCSNLASMECITTAVMTFCAVLAIFFVYMVRL